ncbi:MAG: hypothetical protein EZS28_053747, partial [Streblomastix strix]
AQQNRSGQILRGEIVYLRRTNLRRHTGHAAHAAENHYRIRVMAPIMAGLQMSALAHNRHNKVNRKHAQVRQLALRQEQNHAQTEFIRMANGLIHVLHAWSVVVLHARVLLRVLTDIAVLVQIVRAIRQRAVATARTINFVMAQVRLAQDLPVAVTISHVHALRLLNLLRTDNGKQIVLGPRARKQQNQRSNNRAAYAERKRGHQFVRKLLILQYRHGPSLVGTHATKRQSRRYIKRVGRADIKKGRRNVQRR